MMRLNTNNILGITALVLFAAMVLSACQKESPDKSAQPSGEGSTSSTLGELLESMNMYAFSEKVKAPDFELMSTDGGKVGLSQYRGKIVLLSFWTTW